jgi:hypothetical protein
MTIETAFQGSLFTSDFLTSAIAENADWRALSDVDVKALGSDLKAIFKAFPTDQKPNETRTEDDLIWPILQRLGWTHSMRQQNLTIKGRDDVPDGLLFADEAAKQLADTHIEEWKRYQHGLAIVESKRWSRPLDRRSAQRGEELAPSTQMLRYLRRVDDLTNGNLRWGILTNGARWRLYFSGARSVSEQFLEIDLLSVLGIGSRDLFDLTDVERDHMLRVFYLIFRTEAFVPTPPQLLSFHARAIEDGKVYEDRVANNLSDLVFNSIYPLLARSIAEKAPAASLDSVRQGALILLYRLLFILYAEDRDLLPVNDPRYDDYGLRKRVRQDVGNRKDKNDVFSNTAARYWSVLDDLSRAIDQGDPSIGLPPYNGGLFDAERTPLLREVRLPDSVMADVIDRLSFTLDEGTRKYINYRDLSVQQLGSIYERLLEHEVVREGEIVDIRPNIFARKGSGSYYTPDDLVGLIIDETLEPLIERCMKAFREKAEELATADIDDVRKLAILTRLDPATALLDLRICDPAMGSGHFLVSLVDYLADQVIVAMAQCEIMVEWADYVSPLANRIDEIRNTILGNAEQENWTVDAEQLDDRHIIRRMVLKRCVYGVDKNPMAVELAKVALWLHSFTVGAPLSFLDHHLRCGDSLFGSWVLKGKEETLGFNDNPLFLVPSMTDAIASAAEMQIIERLPDAEIAEAHRSAAIFAGVQNRTAPLNNFLSFIHALHWIDTKSPARRAGISFFIDGVYGDPFMVLAGRHKIKAVSDKEQQVQKMEGGKKKTLTAFEIYQAFQEVLAEAQSLIAEEHFLNWQVAFPGVWSDWQSDGLVGGFDAIIGNPPWDRMKLQQVEWFAARKPDIARAQRAADRAKMIAALEKANDPLFADYQKASARAETGSMIARKSGDYPLLSGGDINLYSLFVERAMTLVKPDGMVGLLTPSGIASDLTASTFFKGVATGGRLKALYDFENKKVFFPAVHASFKFCIFVASLSPLEKPARCAFYLHDVKELDNPQRCFELGTEDFARVNPNTGTAPIFRTRRDATLTARIYASAPVLVDRSSGAEVKAWPVKYSTMFHMTNDSGLFRTRQELEDREGAWPIGGNRFQSAAGEWVPLYEGKMVQAYDHRAASVVVNLANQHRPAQPMPATLEQQVDPSWLPDPQFWVRFSQTKWPKIEGYVLGFKEITAPTNMRTFMATMLPLYGFGNKIPLFMSDANCVELSNYCANLNSIPLDFATRQKIQGQTLNLFVVEQLPVIPPERFEQIAFGKKSAADIVKEAVLELTYTSHDMAPFARDMGYVDDDGNVRPPFVWDEDRRLRLRAKLDAVFFHLYGITDRDDVRYIYSTFPIVERQEIEAHGRYLSRDLCLAYINALSAGQPDAEPMV